MTDYQPKLDSDGVGWCHKHCPLWKTCQWADSHSICRIWAKAAAKALAYMKQCTTASKAKTATAILRAAGKGEVE